MTATTQIELTNASATHPLRIKKQCLVASADNVEMRNVWADMPGIAAAPANSHDRFELRPGERRVFATTATDDVDLTLVSGSHRDIDVRVQELEDGEWLTVETPSLKSYQSVSSHVNSRRRVVASSSGEASLTARHSHLIPLRVTTQEIQPRRAAPRPLETWDTPVEHTLIAAGAQKALTVSDKQRLVIETESASDVLLAVFNRNPVANLRLAPLRAKGPQMHGPIIHPNTGGSLAVSAKQAAILEQLAQ